MVAIFIILAGIGLGIWIVLSCIGFTLANRYRNMSALIGWTGSLIGAGIALSLYIHWLRITLSPYIHLLNGVIT